MHPANWAGGGTGTDRHDQIRSALAGPASGLQGPLRSPLHPDRPTGTHTRALRGGGTTQKAAIPVGYGPLSELGSTHPRRQDDNHTTYRDRPTGNPGGAAFGCWPSRGPRPPYNGAQMPQPPGPPPRRDSLRKALGSQKGAARATGPTPRLLQGRPTRGTSKGDSPRRLARETCKGHLQKRRAPARPFSKHPWQAPLASAPGQPPNKPPLRATLAI